MFPISSPSTSIHLDRLIAIEWDIIENIRRQLDNNNLSVSDKAKLSNTLVYHVNALNRLIKQKEQQDSLEDETTLAELIAKLPKKHRQTLARQIKKWTRQQKNSSKS